MNRGFFITGTDTGAGKTIASCAVVRALASRGHSVGVMKPIETGVGADGPLDAQALRAASQTTSPLEDICPIQYTLPAAPSVAAAHQGEAVELSRVFDAFERIRVAHDCVVVEGAGGLLVPTTANATMADLARDLELPLLLVARAALGTINHTLLSIEAIEQRRQSFAGIIISHTEGVLSDADAENLAFLRERLGAKLIGEIPPLVSGANAPANAIDSAALERALA